MATENKNKLNEIVQAFADAGFIDDVVLIGSWCLDFYTDIFEGFIPSVRTTDIDFYVPDSKKANASSLSEKLRMINYDHFQDSMTGKSRFVSPEGFEIEFLAKLNRNGLSCVRIGSSGIFAELLSYVDIYGSNYIEVVRDGIKVKVASPSAFVIQKILINGRRGQKAEKDAEAIRYVSLFIGSSPKSLQEFRELYTKLPLKWRKVIDEFAKSHGLKLPLALK
ncbi:MAG: hypothetical protein J5627_03985 [Bacilli bacterium]|nr:hypothetical protein [Bacilli bacterium]